MGLAGLIGLIRLIELMSIFDGGEVPKSFSRKPTNERDLKSWLLVQNSSEKLLNCADSMAGIILSAYPW